jgi:hypothetical protein
MRVGILGSGLMGGKLGRVLARAGHEVVFSYARSKAKLQKLASASCLHANLDGKRPTRGCAVGVSRKSGCSPRSEGTTLPASDVRETRLLSASGSSPTWRRSVEVWTRGWTIGAGETCFRLP